MGKQSVNITLDPDVYKDFVELAEPKGIRVSAWINARTKEFIQEERQAQSEKPVKKGRP